MKLHVITVCHMLPEIIAFSTVRGVQTCGFPEQIIDNWVFVDNHFPINKELTHSAIRSISGMFKNTSVVAPEKNIGGHGGFNYGLERCKVGPEDFVLCYDPDSNPVTQGWLKAMIEVMEADPKIGYVSLMDDRCANNRNWKFEEIAGHRFATDDKPEMWNVTLFRGWALEGGMIATTEFYGGVEAAMFTRGFKNGYLYDFRERKCPIPHDESYTAWKDLHAAHATKLNFKEWLEDRK